MDRREMLRRLDTSRVGRLGTVDTVGRPHLVPLVFARDEERLYSAVDHKPKGTTRLKRLSNIAANPSVTLLVDHYSDDWSQLWWVRVDGTARIIETGPEWERAVARLADKYPQYRGYPPSGAVIAITISHLTGWSADAT